MPTLLKNLMLEELSLVDRPANAQAMVSLFKRDNSYEKDVDKMDMEMEASAVINGTAICAANMLQAYLISTLNAVKKEEDIHDHRENT